VIALKPWEGIMKRLAAVAAALLLVPPAVHAQNGTTVEIGTGLGAAILTNGGTLTHIGLPGAGIVGQAPLYATFILGGGLMIQPEVAVNILTGGGSSITTLGSHLGIGYAFAGSGSSPYAFVNGALQYASGGGESDSEFGAGGRVGYRLLVNRGFAVSFEGGYRRWFSSQLGEITIAIRLGGILTAK
jgi:hypothetical protein